MNERASFMYRMRGVVVGLCLVAGSWGCSADSGGNDRTGPPAGQGGATPGGIGATTGATGAAGQADTGFGNGAGAPTVNIDTGVTADDLCREPTVMFVIDGSGSMCAPFGAGTRWSELRGALLGQGGLISTYDNRAEFGMLLFDGGIDLMVAGTVTGGSPSPDCAAVYAFARMGAACPSLLEVPPAVGNASAINGMFPGDTLGGSTPTDKAMNHAVEALIAAQAGRDLMLQPQYLILATDGAPNDICAGGLGGDSAVQQQGVLAAVDLAAANGITTFVISLAGDDLVLQAHLDEVARHGDPANPAAVTFSPETPEALNATLKQLLGTALGCDLE